MQLRFIVVLIVFCGTIPAPSVGAQAGSLDESARQLGDADAAVRDKAAAALRAAGAAAEPALRAVVESGDPETARRARALLRQINQPEIEEPPIVDPPRLVEYRGANRGRKMEIVNELQGGGEDRTELLARLWTEEEEGELRASIFQLLLQEPAPFATALMAQGNGPAAERLLETALSQGNAQAAAPYAALCLLRGKLEEGIARWSPAATKAAAEGENSTISDVVLARLYRAKGDPKAAIAPARRSGDAALLEEALLDARDWPALAEAVAARAAPVVRPRQLGLLAGSRYLAGDGQGFTDAIARMRKLATPETLDDVAHILLLCGKTEEAMRLVLDGGRSTDRFRLLAAQERWKEAFDLLASQDNARDEAALRLRIVGADQLYTLGEERRAAELLTRVTDENRATLHSQPIELLLGETWRRWEQPAKAWEQFRFALKRLEKGQEDPNNIAWQVFRTNDNDGYGGIQFNGQQLWELIQARFPGETFDQRFDRARLIVEDKLSLDELKKLLELVAADPSEDDAMRHGIIRRVGQRMKDAGREEEAERYLANAAAQTQDVQIAAKLYLHLGDWAAEQLAWAKAANWYGRAWNVDRTRPGPLYLRAWALRQGGWHVRSAELMNLAHVLPLADTWKRQEAVARLNERRLTDAMSREMMMILRTAPPDLYAVDAVQRMCADQALRDGDPLAAAAWHERSILNYMGAYEWADMASYLRMPHTVRRERAKGLIAKGDLEAAERDIAACRAMLPGDVMLAIDVVPEFERRGMRQRADELYTEAMRAQDDVLAKYPNSSNHHNNAAWLAANCRRDADKGLTHAKRAVELRPNSAAYVDTLAEMQFYRGEFDAAIKSMQRCVQLEPRTPRHREQLERFEAGKRGEMRPVPPA